MNGASCAITVGSICRWCRPELTNWWTAGFLQQCRLLWRTEGSEGKFQLYVANLLTQLLPTGSRANLDTWLWLSPVQQLLVCWIANSIDQWMHMEPPLMPGSAILTRHCTFFWEPAGSRTQICSLLLHQDFPLPCRRCGMILADLTGFQQVTAWGTNYLQNHPIPIHSHPFPAEHLFPSPLGTEVRRCPG